MIFFGGRGENHPSSGAEADFPEALRRAGTPSPPGPILIGRIATDVSGAVYPLSKRTGAYFAKLNPGVEVSITASGTSGGQMKFCCGLTNLNSASRPINARDIVECHASGHDYLEPPATFGSIEPSS